jgi:hypothetical protein
MFLIVELFSFCIYIHMYICVVIFHFLILVNRLVRYFISLRLYRVLSHSRRRASCPENRNIEIVYVYVNKSSNSNGDSSLLVFLIYFWCEYKKNERGWEKVFLFASLTIESIYAFYMLFSFYSILRTYILMAAGFVCSSSFFLRYSN